MFVNEDDVMFDLETADTIPASVILSIGVTRIGGDAFDVLIWPNVARQLLMGRTVGKDTMKWWRNQDSKAQISTFDPPNIMPLEMVATLMRQLVTDAPQIWCNGPSFDFSILRDFMAQMDPTFKWPFYKERDYRTVRNVFKDVEVTGSPAVAHDALSDARFQRDQLKRYASIGASRAACALTTTVVKPEAILQGADLTTLPGTDVTGVNLTGAALKHGGLSQHFKSRAD